jgi:hypothetical protein
VVAGPAAGRLIFERSAAAIAEAVRAIESSPPRRSETRRYAEQFGWTEIAQANRALLTIAGAAGYDGRHDPAIVAATVKVLSWPREPDAPATIAMA